MMNALSFNDTTTQLIERAAMVSTDCAPAELANAIYDQQLLNTTDLTSFFL